MAERTKQSTREDYARFVPVTTRWMDNDVYGHVNNVVYYSFFDTAVNGILVEAGVLDPKASDTVGLVVSTRCDYFASVAFPDEIEVGVAVAATGRSSVTYRLGVFRAGESRAAARGEFVHVYVDRATRRPVEIPAPVRAVLEGLRLPSPPPPG